MSVYWLYLKNELMELTIFFPCWYKFTQIKRWLKIFGVSMFKNGCDQTGDKTLNWLYLENEQME